MSLKLVLVVTGSRRATGIVEMQKVHDALVEVYDKYGSDVLLIHGDQTGVDTRAAVAGSSFGWSVWAMQYISCLGKRGGPVRNHAMVHAGYITSLHAKCERLCLAFPDAESVGTYQCKQAAAASGYKIKEIML